MSDTDKEELDQSEQQSEIIELEDPNELESFMEIGGIQDPEEKKLKVTRPIRLKMILAFGVVLSLALSIFLYYSLQLFFSDKKNYILEAGLNHIDFVKTSTEEKITNFSQQVSVFSSLSEKYPEEMKKVINSQSDLMAFYTLSDKLVILNTFTNKKMPAQDIEGLKAPLLAEKFPSLTAVEPDKFFLIPAKNLTSRSAVLMGIKNSTSQKISVGVLDISSTLNLAKKNKIFETTIQSMDGINFLTGQKKTSPIFKQIINNRFNTGTEILGEKKNKLFVSYVKLPEKNIVIIATIPKDVAFQAAYDLIRKTIGYGLILLGLAFGVAVFMALSITRPLKRLVDQTELVSNGEFNQVELVRSSDEIGLLGESISKMSLKIVDILDQKQEIIHDREEARSELERYSINLENLLEQKTEELKHSNNFISSIIDYFEEGLFVIDENGKCTNTFTTACERLFEKSPKDRKFQDLLRYEQEGEDEQTLLRWITTLFDSKLEFESLKALGPQSMEFETLDGQRRYLKFSYFPMYDDFDDIKNITVVASDMTSEKFAVTNLEKKSAEVEMILKILASRKNFINFLKTSKHMIEELNKEISSNSIDIEKIKTIVLTVKGNFGLYSIIPIYDYCHILESEIASVQELYSYRNEWVDFLNPRFKKLKEEFEIFCGVASKIVGFDVNKDDTYQRISNERLESFAKEIRQTGDLKLFSKFRYEFVYSRLSEHFRPYYDLTFELADLLGKKMKPLKFTNTSIRIDELQYRGFLSSLLHVFRYILNIAIEMPQDRLALKKDEEGLITIDPRIVERKNLPYFRLSITNDGRGIDPMMIREKIKTKKMNIPAEEMSDEEILYVIFSSEFSSKDIITQLSGRGNNLSAVKEEVIKLGGEIEIKTKLLVGTTFIFYLPYKIIEPFKPEDHIEET